MVSKVLNTTKVQIIIVLTVSLEYIDLFTIFYPKTSYHVGIMLDVFNYLLCLNYASIIGRSLLGIYFNYIPTFSLIFPHKTILTYIEPACGITND